MSNNEESEKKAGGEETISKLLMLGAGPSEPEVRSMTIIGDVSEELSKDVIAALWFLKQTAKSEELVNPEDPECEEVKEVIKPMEIIISTNGGNADDMFAIYDTMRMVKEDCEIHTVGLGKVMSAGVVLLAAGTKGKRKIGANCRVMIHSVIGGHHGSIQNLENEMEEVRWVQDQYNKALCAETDLTPRMLKRLLSKNVNIYLTAQEAVDYGIADIII
jgi:ATP-dependent Clp endopeptidase proteolytic subunit ClpP